ncbi:hypothetical protein LMG31506_00501 [Cupriavidus yeoncheonensis]|uniref:ABC-2 type transporter transmembrane domain-containing protein n=2 Tax=Cupriavidus yeoncheonensis TaxID=1462994 RepID=A0A916IPP4_9BURK|nr:hypothetical protein LMG31506_00501 [Cupriavidus yeoncheonensis]
MGVMIGTIGVVFGQIFKSPLKEFLPYLSAGMILWTFVSSVIMEGCTGFIAAEGIIKQLPIPLFVHILRMIWRNLLILAHNIVILPLVFLIVGKPLSIVAFLSIPGLLLAIVNLMWVALILAVLCARYRDLPQMVNSVLQVIFYLTPIMWLPSSLPERAGLYLLDMNPVYHLLEIVRSPLLGQLPTATNWNVSLALALIGWGVAITVFGRYKHRIAYWL